ncbi:MAG: hypothetical protein WCW54_04145 [Candidatus Paceibacterota bacterium]
MGKLFQNPEKQYYNKLLQNRHFFINLFITSLFALFGYWRISFDKREVFYFLPLIFLVTLRIMNWVALMLKERNIIIATRWDGTNIKGGITWLDRLLSILTLLIPILVCGLIMNSI